MSLEPSAVGQLRAAVLRGAFDEAVDLLEQLPLSSPDDVQRAKFLVLQQKFLEVTVIQHTPPPLSARAQSASMCLWMRLHDGWSPLGATGFAPLTCTDYPVCFPSDPACTKGGT